MSTLDDLGFTPGTPAQAATPTPVPSSSSFNDLGFIPQNGPATGAPAAPAQGGGFGQFALNAGKGIMNAIDNNPITQLPIQAGALPVQGLAKLLGQPDPYANGAMGGVHVTTSDQPFSKWAEETAGNALNFGSLFIPAGKIAEVAAPYLSGLGRFAAPAARIGTQTAIGGIQGLGGGMQQGQSGEELKGSAKVGSMLGFGLSTAGELGSALIDNFAANTPSSRLEQQTNRLKTLQNSFDDNTTFTRDAGGKIVVKADPISTLTDTGLVKGLRVVDGRVNTEAVDGGLQDLMAQNDARSTQLVKDIPGTMSLEDFKNAAIKAVKNNPQIRDAGKTATALAEVERRFSSYEQSFGTFAEDGKTLVSDEVPYPTINNIRIAMNREFDPEARDVARTIGDTARTILYDEKTGSPELQQVMSKQGDLLKAQNFVDRLRGTVVRGGRLGKYLADMVGSGVGTAMGSTMGPFGMGVGAVAGGAAADKAMGIYQNAFFNPVLSRPAQAAGRILGAPATQAAITIGKGALIPSAVQK